MEEVINALKEGRIEKINQFVASQTLRTPVLYKEFLKLSSDKLSNETLALYASGPLNIDLLLGLDKDPYHEEVIYRICNESMSMKGLRWYYNLFKKDSHLFEKLRLIEPLKSFYIEQSPSTDHTWLLALIGNQRYQPNKAYQLIIQELWDHDGVINDDEMNVFPLGTPSIIISFLFYFSDVLSQATKTLNKIFKNSKDKVLNLDLLWYHDFLKANPTLKNFYGLDTFPIALFDPSKTSIKRTQGWLDIDIPRIIFSCFKRNISPDRWINELDLSSSMKKKLLGSMSVIEFLEKVVDIVWNNDKEQKYDIARIIFKAAPADVLREFMKQKKHPILVATGIVERGFTLDDSCLYLLANHDGYELSYKQLQDMLMRFRGTKEGLNKFIAYEMKRFNDITNCWHLGYYYHDERLFKAGSGIIKESYTFDQYDVSDILIKVTFAHIELMTKKYFDQQSVYYDALMNETEALYGNR